LVLFAPAAPTALLSEEEWRDEAKYNEEWE
jgi:hypothetical protein